LRHRTSGHREWTPKMRTYSACRFSNKVAISHLIWPLLGQSAISETSSVALFLQAFRVSL
jgi:hypothetical protein